MPENWTKTIVKNEVDHLIYRPAGGDTIEIFDILVESKRGQGVGTAMLKELLETEKPTRVVAITRETNTLAQKFYFKNGFVGCILPRFYPDGNAIMFIKCV